MCRGEPRGAEIHWEICTKNKHSQCRRASKRIRWGFVPSGTRVRVWDMLARGGGTWVERRLEDGCRRSGASLFGPPAPWPVTPGCGRFHQKRTPTLSFGSLVLLFWKRWWALHGFGHAINHLLFMCSPWPSIVNTPHPPQPPPTPEVTMKPSFLSSVGGNKNNNNNNFAHNTNRMLSYVHVITKCTVLRKWSESNQ